MSCCGSKRQALIQTPAQGYRSVTTGTEIETAPSPVQFRYSGNSVLEVRGFLNRRKYVFSQRTPVVSVASEDVPILHGFDELTQVF